MNFSHATFIHSIHWPRPLNNGRDTLGSAGTNDGFTLSEDSGFLRVEKGKHAELVPWSNVLQVAPEAVAVAPEWPHVVSVNGGPFVEVPPADKMAKARAAKAAKQAP